MHKFEIEILSAKLKANGVFGIAGAVAVLGVVLALVWHAPGLMG